MCIIKHNHKKTASSEAVFLLGAFIKFLLGAVIKFINDS